MSSILVVRFIEMRAFAVTVAARGTRGGLGVGTQRARGPLGNLGGLGVEFFDYILLDA